MAQTCEIPCAKNITHYTLTHNYYRIELVQTCELHVPKALYTLTLLLITHITKVQSILAVQQYPATIVVDTWLPLANEHRLQDSAIDVGGFSGQYRCPAEWLIWHMEFHMFVPIIYINCL